ncbi:DUF6602 domain-containing protein [Chryseobacterium indoltheticum]|uniref:DUF6602 domain-containing protein n=1 Tax=Chryseobacterium indoltheticum TaxID=254 RepID=A0A381FD45_9FLAO|nr:DUF6602 domain-containing protein [Chryseobacterium indoltheticum]SIQ95373.1 hypothetical protein SAMN05421682_110137 [Chryseobacterium indoltheticum]SUX44012.1 Uncharacterised protein [Chryseobacterium indoltheticum]
MEDHNPNLKMQIPNLGWQQFLTGRNEMLKAYDIAREHSRKRQVQSGHGLVAEAEFRKWLSNFLPKRYGVTSGFIISQGIPNTEYPVHFDVIIYDQLESPVLWVEGSSDLSRQGRSLAIPVEYVYGVIEVKSAFNRKSSKKAVNQLAKLKPLMSRVEPDNQPVKLYLPKNFFCAAVFFELRKQDEMDFVALDELVEATKLRGFNGGYILRGETLENLESGKLTLIEEKENTVPDNKSMLFWATSKPKQFGDNKFKKIMLHFSETHFSEFAFDIIAMLKGSYNPYILSSLYGFGTTQFENGSSMDIKYFNPEDHKKFNEQNDKFFNNLNSE